MAPSADEEAIYAAVSMRQERIVALGRRSEVGGGVGLGARGFVTAPAPAQDFGHVFTVLGDVVLVLDQLLADGLLGVGGARAELRHAIDDVADQVVAI